MINRACAIEKQAYQIIKMNDLQDRCSYFTNGTDTPVAAERSGFLDRDHTVLSSKKWTTTESDLHFHNNWSEQTHALHLFYSKHVVGHLWSTVEVCVGTKHKSNTWKRENLWKKDCKQMLTNPRFWLKRFGEIKSSEVEKHKWCLAEFRGPMHVPRNFHQHKNQKE